MAPSIFLGELLGTMVLILLGDGVVAAVLLNKSKANNAGWIVITTGWAMAVTIGVFVSQAFGSPGAHLNPAVTLFDAIRNGNWATMPAYLGGQFLGAFIGATLVWLHYLPHWKETEDAGLKLAVFSTGPAIRNTATNLVSEVIGTFMLVLGVTAIFNFDVSPALGPYLVGMLVWAIGLSLGGPTGYAINPARDLGPRIAHLVLPIAGKGDSDFAYGWIPVVGPLAGAALGAVLLMVIQLA